jgi:hypothetical protein
VPAAARRRARLPAAALLLALALAGCGTRDAAPAPPIQTERLLVGAYYYSWYPRNFRQGYLRGNLVPRQQPALGIYESTDPATVERHIAWASRYGVDFFSVGWHPARDERNRAALDALLAARNVGDVRFCIHYETWSLGFDTARGMTVFDQQKADRFVEDLVGIAKSYFDHPSYLKVGGRPVLMLYLTRTLVGDFAPALARARAELRRLGFDPLIVGDEVFWQVAPVGGAAGGPALTEDPQPSRARLFDAITAYNLYENQRPSQKGYPAASTFAADAVGLYERYRAAAGPGVYLVPNIVPGYNDRGVRRRADHYPIPRQWEPGAPEGSTLAAMFDRVAFPLLDPRLNLLMLTTWNEWNEDTAIEPLDPAPPTTRDASPSGREYTQGYAYSGHGTVPLEVVRDKVVAVAGRVTDAAGAPRQGVEVAAARDGKVLARGRSDRDGYYRISRLGVGPGPCVVSAAGAAATRTVQVVAGRAAVDADLTLAP